MSENRSKQVRLPADLVDLLTRVAAMQDPPQTQGEYLEALARPALEKAWDKAVAKLTAEKEKKGK